MAGTGATIYMHLNEEHVVVSHRRHILGEKEEWWSLSIETTSHPVSEVTLSGLTPEAVRALRDGAQALLEAMGEAMGTETPDAPA